MSTCGHAVIDGAASLVNGTLLSTREAPSEVGTAVQATDFIVAEGSRIDGGAMIASCYVGQGCRLGRQFSAEGSLFFANCEGFHGEACSVFAGPYTVTHHKSTLLIAGLFSFYNAGSGTNQSNHMYKLGPVHEGKLERGCKTGSFSYLMWPCRVGPFSVVLGKHTRTFDTAEFPFSHLQATADGRCEMVPGMYLMTVGTLCDGAKWPQRDRRAGRLRDRISFDVLSPLTVGRMIRGRERLRELELATDRSAQSVNVGGADIRRVLLRTGQKYYRTGIEMYLLEKVVARAENGLESEDSLRAALAVAPQAVADPEWLDLGGQMMPRQRLAAFCAAVVSGSIADKAAFDTHLDAVASAQDEDEWAWVKQAYQRVFEVNLDSAPIEHFTELADSLLAVQGKFLRMVDIDVSKEFEDLARAGFGQDGDSEDVANDFAAVRGTYEENSFVRQLKQAQGTLETRIKDFKAKLADLA